jgi:ATP phosphoribosyltransferase
LTSEETKERGQRIMLNVALPKGRIGKKVREIFSAIGYECEEPTPDDRRLVIENSDGTIRYFLVKPSDVGIYVERGAADIGVVGKDTLVETEPDVYELLDLDIGKCSMAVAAKETFRDNPGRTLRVATKFANVAKNYYASLGRDIDIIHLNGSIELAPILALSDVIVDIVETGTTLKENKLEVIEKFIDISARLIANKANFKFKSQMIEKVKESLKTQVEAND